MIEVSVRIDQTCSAGLLDVFVMSSLIDYLLWVGDTIWLLQHIYNSASLLLLCVHRSEGHDFGGVPQESQQTGWFYQ